MAAGVSGAVAVVIMAVAGRFVDVNALAASVGMTPADLQSAVAVIVAAVAGYVVRERAHPAARIQGPQVEAPQIQKPAA
jgi:hypothetical protein